MKRARMAISGVLIGAVLTLSACGADPCAGLSDDSYQKVVNYAAGMLMKYSVGSQDKLTYLDPTYTPEYLVAEIQKEEAAPDTASSSASTVTSSSASASTSKSDKTTSDAASDDTANTGASKGEELSSDESANTGTGAGEETSDTSLATDSGAEDSTGYETGSTQIHSRQDGEQAASNTVIDDSFLQSLSASIQIEYIGYSVRNNYPDAQLQGAVSAAMGDKLLVVTFHARNTSDEELMFNTIQSGVKYKLVINSDINGFCLTTMLDNDLSGVYTNIPAKEYKEVVLLMEIPESVAKSINTLDLVVINKGEQQTIRLE